jgi:hypothetical protein
MIRRADYATPLFPQKLALTSLTSGGRSVGIVRSRIQATEFILLFCLVAPQLYSRGWVDHFPDPLLLSKSGSAENRIRDLCIFSQEPWPYEDHLNNIYAPYPSRSLTEVLWRSRAVVRLSATSPVFAEPLSVLVAVSQCFERNRYGNE